MAFAALRAHEGAKLRPVAFAVLGLLLAVRASRLEAWGRFATWGLAIVLTAAGANAGGWLDAFALVGAACAFASACMAVARMRGVGGLGASRASSPKLGLATGGIAWVGAVGSSVAATLGHGGWLAQNPRAWSIGAPIVSGLVVLRLAMRTAKARRLDLGVPARAHAVAATTAVAMALGAVASALIAPPDRVTRLVVALAAMLVVEIALAVDADRIARFSRRAVALAMVAGPIILLGMTVSESRPRDAVVVTAVTAIVAIVAAMRAPAFESSLRPAQGVWLDAVDAAHEATLRADPEDALREVLFALRAPALAHGGSPLLLTLDPPRAMGIDAAGYVHAKDVKIPPELLDVAAREPEAALRTEVLAALEVRRPDLRGLLRWMIDRNAMLAIVVTHEAEAEGILIVPNVPRSDPVSLEEVRALKRLADSLAGAIFVKAALARSMERERAARARAEAAEDHGARLQHEVDLGASRNVLAATRLARPATVGIYSAASRLSLEAIRKRVRAGAPLALVVPSGIDAVPYIARAHLEGPRGNGPLVLVDGTSSREHDPARWIDPTVSPLGLADGGTLVLLDGAALPVDIQRLIARSLSERRVPWERPEPLDVALVITGASPPSELVDEGRLDAALATRLGDAVDGPVALPRLRERPEDVRAIVTDRLAREGLRRLGRPVGLEDAAFARLVEHPFEGEDTEVQLLVQHLVARLTGRGADVVRAADVDAVLAETAVLVPVSSVPGGPERRPKAEPEVEVRLSKPFRP